MKKNKRKVKILIFFVLLTISFLFVINKIKDENHLLSSSINTTTQIKVLLPEEQAKHFAKIEIPDISLKEYLINPNSKNNDVNKSIEIIFPSKMPDKSNSLLVLAAHSGNSSVSYFKNLYKLKENNLVYIYFNDITYIYKVIKTENQNKNGQISIDRNLNKSILILTTCNQKNRSKQIVITSELKEAIFNNRISD